MVKKISLVVLIIGYIAAGINHFRVPAFYIGIIPAYMPCPQLLNTLAGIFEIMFGALLIFTKTRKLAAWGLIVLLVAFLPVHINMLYSHTQLGALTVTPVKAWLRLFLQPVLIWWVWWHTRSS